MDTVAGKSHAGENEVIFLFGNFFWFFFAISTVDLVQLLYFVVVLKGICFTHFGFHIHNATSRRSVTSSSSSASSLSVTESDSLTRVSLLCPHGLDSQGSSIKQRVFKTNNFTFITFPIDLFSPAFW